MKIINLDKVASNGTYIGFTNSSMYVDEDYETVVKRLVCANKYMQLHSGGEPVLIAVDKVELIGKMEAEEW